MASHPSRPYEDERRVNERASPTVERSHPSVPYPSQPLVRNNPYPWSAHGRQRQAEPAESRRSNPRSPADR